MTMTLTSSAFTNGGAVPRRHTCDGENLSPALAWSGLPEGAQSLLLLCDDPDAPRGVFHHWALFNIPVDRTSLEEGFATKGREGEIGQAINDFGEPGYGGPCPPRGDKPHRYRFRLSALDAVLGGLAPRASCADVAKAAKPHVLATAELTGVYGRKR